MSMFVPAIVAFVATATMISVWLIADSYARSARDQVLQRRADEIDRRSRLFD